jgi:anaerobic selenocysteine-containing dehydrogenase
MRIQLMRQHYSRYTVDQVENICGDARDKVLDALGLDGDHRGA